MKSDAKEIKQRLAWITLYQETGDAGLTCRRCGISRPTLRKWLGRYEELGVGGLKGQSKRPKRSPTRKIGDQQAEWILKLRSDRKLGVRRIQNELKQLHGLSLSLSTIHKVLTRHKVEPLRRIRRVQTPKRYQKATPGERVQMDTCKIAPGLYQYTAVDDCTRYQVLRLYPRRTAANTLLFLECVVDEMPFPVQRIQTDRGTEFTAYKVQDRLLEWGIKFRPVRPASPHLNGKVERAQRTDLDEFYSLIDLSNPWNRSIEELDPKLAEWQQYYNWERVHGSIGKPPIDKWHELMWKTPYYEEVSADFDPAKEAARIGNYSTYSRTNGRRKLKRSA
jgi:transposase InsO family protein